MKNIDPIWCGWILLISLIIFMTGIFVVRMKDVNSYREQCQAAGGQIIEIFPHRSTVCAKIEILQFSKEIK